MVEKKVQKEARKGRTEQGKTQLGVKEREMRSGNMEAQGDTKKETRGMSNRRRGRYQQRQTRMPSQAPQT